MYSKSILFKPETTKTNQLLNSGLLYLLMLTLLYFLNILSASSQNPSVFQENKPTDLSLATFDVDATPPVGSYMAYGRVINTWDMGLRARILRMPGELFVEYQLAAKAERPDLFLAMAAYGDYGPEYICTDIAYWQGGYEGGDASGVAPGSEKILMAAIKNLLHR